MNKAAAGCLLGATILLFPAVASASPLTDFVSWLVPSIFKPAAEITKTSRPKGVGGIFITSTEPVTSGDTSRAFHIPTLASRTFTISNSGVIDLFLNKATTLSYTAAPAAVPGDVPNALALNVGTERIVTIFNPSTTTSVYLSKIDLGIISSGTASQSSIFINNSRAAATILDISTTEGAAMAGISFSFNLNNASNRDIYVSRLINPLDLVSLAEVQGLATASIKFIDAALAAVPGDTQNVYVIPAGTTRKFELTGIIDNTKGIPGIKSVAVSSINYSFSPALTDTQRIRDTVMLRSLTTPGVMLASGELRRPPAVAGSATSSAAAAPASPAGEASRDIPPAAGSKPRVSPTLTPTLTASPTAGAALSATPTFVPASDVIIPAATTKIGPALLENGQIVGYPITYTFTLQAPLSTIFLSKNPAIAFSTQQTGFGTVLPSIGNISASPSLVSGDTGGYFVIPAGTSRDFSAFAILKNDGLMTSGSKIFQIAKIVYGTRASALQEKSTIQKTANLKAIVILSPRASTTPAPSASVSPSPTYTSTPSPTPTPTTSTSPSPTYTPTYSPSPSSSSSPSPSPSSSSSPSPSQTTSSAPSPSSSASPSSSSSASPSASGSVGAIPAARYGFVASALYSIGDFLDYLFTR